MHFRKLIALSAFAGLTVMAQQQSAQPGQQPRESTPQTQESRQQSTTQTPEGRQQSTSSPDHHSAGSAAHSTDAPATLSKNDHTFMIEAARGGLMEVQVAQMAQQKAASDDVKQYARQLEQDHSKANEKLKAIAQERGVQLPTDLGQHQTQVQSLNALSGEEFDRQFMKMQVQHHKKDVKQFSKQSKNSIDTDLREFAAGNLPTLEQRLRQAQTLASQTGTRSRSK